MSSKAKVVYLPVVEHRELRLALEVLWRHRELQLLEAVDQRVRDVLVDALREATRKVRPIRRPRRRRK